MGSTGRRPLRAWRAVGKHHVDRLYAGSLKRARAQAVLLGGAENDEKHNGSGYWSRGHCSNVKTTRRVRTFGQYATAKALTRTGLLETAMEAQRGIVVIEARRRTIDRWSSSQREHQPTSFRSLAVELRLSRRETIRPLSQTQLIVPRFPSRPLPAWTISHS